MESHSLTLGEACAFSENYHLEIDMKGINTLKTCVIDGCNRPHLSLGLCRRHYDEARRDDPEQKRRFREASKRFNRSHKVGKKNKTRADIVVTLPTEFCSEHGIVIQLEKVIGALEIHGIRYERSHQPPKVSLKDGIKTLRENYSCYNINSLKEEQEE